MAAIGRLPPFNMVEVDRLKPQSVADIEVSLSTS
jgi:hypothetical protein